MEEAEGFEPPGLLHPTIFKIATHTNVSASMAQGDEICTRLSIDYRTMDPMVEMWGVEPQSSVAPVEGLTRCRNRPSPWCP